MSREYRRTLGLFELVALGVGGTIGSGIFVVPGIAAAIAGPSALLAWLLAAISAGCVLLSLAWVSSRFPATGAFYAVFKEVFGRRLSTSLVLLYLVSALFGVATIGAGIGQYLAFFGIGSVLWIEVLILVIFAAVNLIGVRSSGIAENILTTLKTIPLIVIAIFLLPYVRAENFVPFSPHGETQFLKAVIVVYWAYTGFEISAIPAGEIKDTGSIFKSLMAVLLIVSGVYLSLNVALIGAAGVGVLAASPAPIAAAVGIFIGSNWIVAAIGILAMLSAQNAYLVGTTRVLQNISQEYRIPFLSGLSGRGVPHVSIVAVTAASASLLFFTNRFQDLASASVLLVLLPYIFICIAALRLFGGLRVRAVAGLGLLSTLAVLLTSVLL